jgi:replication factor C subunit 3/5
MITEAAAQDNKPWVEKYRPKTLDDVAAHKEIVDTSECVTLLS